jgi:serine/threonine-protein kinase RsbW
MCGPMNGSPRSNDGLEAQAPTTCQEARVHTEDQVPSVLACIQAAMQTIDYVPRDVHAVRIAVREALLNAIQHGHRGDPTRCARLTYVVTPAYVLVEVMDEGPGFDPTQVPVPLLNDDLTWSAGRGLFLMQQLMTWIRFSRQGNVCVLCLRRTRHDGLQPDLTPHLQENDPCNRIGS